MLGHGGQILVGFEEKRSISHADRVVGTGTRSRGSLEPLIEKRPRKLGLYRKALWFPSGLAGRAFMNKTMVGLIEKALIVIFAYPSAAGRIQSLLEEMDKEGISDARQRHGRSEYIYDMPLVMAAADLVVCRSGASTLSELCVLGKPAILVPSPNVTNNHQEKNARVLERAGAAVLIPEAEISADKLLGSVSLLLSRPDTLEAMSTQMKSIGVSDERKIADIVLSLVK